MILFSINLLSQQKGSQIYPSPINVFLETNIIYSDTLCKFYLSYRVPFDQLIFIKNNSEYSAGLTLNIEIQKEKNVVDRKTSTKNITVDSYEKTKFNNDYVQGFIKFDDFTDSLILIPSITIFNSTQTIPLNPITLRKNSFLKNNIITPIIVQKITSVCSDRDAYQLVNFNSSIPFSPDNITLLFEVLNDDTNDLEVKVEQGGEEIIKQKIKSFINSDYKLEECNNSILLKEIHDLKNTKYFVFNDFSFLLDEGEANIKISTNEKEVADFNLPIKWINKPKTLLNPEFAIELLRIIDKDEKVDSLLSNDSKDYLKVLNNYWKNKSLSKKNEFNELKYEFYKRADYAMENFNTIGNQKGALTDRGKIYIRYGKPDDVEREYSNSSIVKEIWKYYTQKKEFIFTDNSGLGNYILDKGQ